MAEHDLARLGYLVLLGLALGGWLIAEHRKSWGTLVRQAALWCFIFLGAMAGAGLWQDVRHQIVPQQLSFSGDTTVYEAPRAYDGHYYVTLHINRVPVNFVVDTGATDIVLTRRDARRLGVETENLDYSGRAGTANGEVRTAKIRIEEIALGPVVDRNFRVLINSGDMETSLLGMSYLQKFSRLEIAEGRILLER